MEKKIVFLGNGNDWCEIALRDLRFVKSAKLINTSLPCPTNKIKTKFVKWHYSQTISHYIDLPFKSMWFGYFAETICKERDTDLVIVIYDRHRLSNNEKFLVFLRNYYSNVKLVYVFTNVVRISGAGNNKFVDKLNQFYDIVYAFDPEDALVYGFKWYQNVYAYISYDRSKIEKSVFFVGKAKDRHPMIVDIYKRLKKLNINTNFYVTDVPEDEQIKNSNIVYNKALSYLDVQKKVQLAGCVLDVIQKNSSGYTLKVCEAVAFDKLLITTNERIKNEVFYDPHYMLVIKNAEEIDLEFFNNYKSVSYSKEAKDFFSVESFIKTIYQDLRIK